jgi:hypothetical protein
MKTAVMLFSGGVDSTYTAMKVAPGFDRLVLNTYRVPGMVSVEHSRRSSRQLQRLHPDKIVHNIIDLRDFVYAIRGGVRQCVKDNRAYRFYYSWCLGCKVSMHLYTIEYCRRHEITRAIDGSNLYDVHALEQHEDVKSVFGSLYKLEGIEFITPFYDEGEIQSNRGKVVRLMRQLSLYKDATQHRIDYLREQGIDLGRGFVSQFRQTQPSCLASLCFNGFRLAMKMLRQEVPGCCGVAHGYLNYVKDKALGRETEIAEYAPGLSAE